MTPEEMAAEAEAWKRRSLDSGTVAVYATDSSRDPEEVMVEWRENNVSPLIGYSILWEWVTVEEVSTTIYFIYLERGGEVPLSMGPSDEARAAHEAAYWK